MAADQYNPAGVYGPRGCARLARPFRQRLQTQADNWLAPTAKTFFISPGQTIIAAPANPNRANLTFLWQAQPAVSTQLMGLGMAVPPALLFGFSPIYVDALNVNELGYFSHSLQYPYDGGRTTGLWYAGNLAGAGDNAALVVTEQLYMG